MTDMENNQDETLLQHLRQLPAERVPPATAWPAIAARLGPQLRVEPVTVMPAASSRRRPRRWLGYAGAAAAVIALFGVVTVMLPERPAVEQVAGRETSVERQANTLTFEYRRAIAAIPHDSVPVELKPALQELDSSAGSIRAAIAQSPDAGFLLGQLQRTYALRIELTRQGLAAPGLST